MLEINKIPQNYTRNKIVKFLNREISADFWDLERIIPLDNGYLTVCISCHTEEIEKQFLATAFEINGIRLLITSDATIIDSTTSNLNVSNTTLSLLDLNDDCIYLIVKNLSLKAQINLAKVCRYFYEFIYEIWKKKYKTFLYRLTDELTVAELRDFHTIIGPFVKHLTFDGILTIGIVQLSHVLPFSNCKSLMENLKIYFNLNLCRNLMNFVNLEVFEVLGTTFLDFTFAEMARYCKKLKAIRLITFNDRQIVRCSHLHKFEYLEELYIENCCEFQRKSFLNICRSNKNLRLLNINGVHSLNSTSFLLNVSNYWQNLTHLTLIAVENENLLAHLLKTLKNLKILKFLWIYKSNSRGATKFELLLFQQLALYKSNELVGLKFEIDHLRIGHMPMGRMNYYDNEMKREYTVMRGVIWNLSENFTNIAVHFEKYKNLQSLCFIFCRLFSNEDILKLRKLCKNLKKILLYGNRKTEDNYLLNEWHEEQLNKELPEEDCKLFIRGLLTPRGNKELRLKLDSMVYRTTTLMPTIRSIECIFDSK